MMEGIMQVEVWFNHCVCITVSFILLRFIINTVLLLLCSLNRSLKPEEKKG